MVNSLATIAKQFDNEVIMPLREAAIGRKLIPRNNALSGKGIGMQQVEYYTFGDLTAAIMDYALPENDVDTVDVTTSTLKMVYMQKGYTIPRTVYESFRLKGIPIDSDAALACTDLIAKAENTLFIQGWAPDGSTYKVPGLYQTAVNNSDTDSTANDFGTYGNAINEVAKVIAALQVQNVYGPYNLVLHPTQYVELAGSYSSTGSPEWDQVMKLLNQNSGQQVGQIFSTTALTAGTGFVSAIGKKYFDYVEAQPLKNELGTDSAHPDTGPIIGNLYEAVVPRIKQAAVYNMTGI